MLKKITIILITTLALTVSATAASDGELILKKNQPDEIKDCSETFNRGVFALNEGLDKAIFKPVASVYKKFPSPFKSGVSNSLDNLSNLVTIPNNLLQGDFSLALENTGRLVVNTTVGIFGIFDVAQHLGFSEYVKEDYGQSFAKAGMGPGCYIVLPVLGSSTVRDTAGSLINFFGGDPWYSATVINNNHYFEDSDYYYSRATQGVDFRAKNYNAIENLEKNSLDFYASVKSLYLQDRQQKIINTNQIIETQDDSDWDEITN